MTAISPQEPKETVQKREMKTKSFTGVTMEQALRNARQELGSDLLHTDIVRDIHEATATSQARAAADALEEVGQRFPEESFDRHTPAIVQEAQTGIHEPEVSLHGRAVVRHCTDIEGEFLVGLEFVCDRT